MCVLCVGHVMRIRSERTNTQSTHKTLTQHVPLTLRRAIRFMVHMYFLSILCVFFCVFVCVYGAYVFFVCFVYVFLCVCVCFMCLVP